MYQEVPRVITDFESLADLAERLGRERRIAVDTESASFHRYRDRVYLIQLSSEQENAVVDPLAVQDLEPIARLLADSRVEKVFHDADYDLRVLDRDYGFRAKNLFDTRVAAELLGEPSVGLAGLLHKYFGVTLEKKLQRADWSLRPLPERMLAYAVTDTVYLLPLRDLLERKLKESGRWEWALEEFARLEATHWSPSQPEGPLHRRVKAWRSLTPRDLAVLEALLHWREEKARLLDRPVFKILSNEALVEIARRKPQDAASLLQTSKLPEVLAVRYRDELLNAVRQGLSSPLPEQPKEQLRAKRRSPSDAAVKQRLERLKRLRDRRAEELKIAPGILCPNATLLAIAEKQPSDPAELAGIVELRKWQRKALGEEAILQAVAG